MPQPRYSEALKKFIHDWRPHDPQLDQRFIEAVRQLVAAIVSPPAGQFEVETILSPTGGKVVLRVADYEAQIAPLDAQHLALSLVEAATAARTESWLFRFLLEQVDLDAERAARVIGEFRNYRTEEMQRELDGDFARRSASTSHE
jgi:hypothetical protein